VPNAQVPPVSTVGKPGNTARKQGNKAQWPASLTGYPTHVTFSYPARVVGATACHPPSPAQPCHATPRYPAAVTRHLSQSVTRLKRPVVPASHAMPCHAMPCQATSHHVTRKRLPGTYHGQLPGSSDRSCQPCHAGTPRYPEEVTRHLSRSVTQLRTLAMPIDLPESTEAHCISVQTLN